MPLPPVSSAMKWGCASYKHMEFVRVGSNQLFAWWNTERNPLTPKGYTGDQGIYVDKGNVRQGPNKGNFNNFEWKRWLDPTQSDWDLFKFSKRHLLRQLDWLVYLDQNTVKSEHSETINFLPPIKRSFFVQPNTTAMFKEFYCHLKAPTSCFQLHKRLNLLAPELSDCVPSNPCFLSCRNGDMKR